MDNMVLGVDYFVEDIIITDKRIETDVNDTIHENYFFIIMTEMHMIIINGCKFLETYLDSTKLGTRFRHTQLTMYSILMKNMGYCLILNLGIMK